MAALTLIENATASAEDEIRDLIADWMGAFCAKDVERLMTHYAPDIVAFDVKPPFQLRGKAVWRSVFEEGLRWFPESFYAVTRDLRVIVDGEVAFAHWLWRFASDDKNHPAIETWRRASAGYRRQGGRWKIVHEHVSLPFDPHTSRVVFSLQP